MAANKTDVLVIGGGLAGLATAAYLARGGRQVTVLERSKHLGGRATTRHEQGFSLNLGAHALYRRGPAQAVLAELGVNYTGKAPSTRGLALFDGRLHRLPVGPGSLAATGLLSLRDKVFFAGLFARLPKFRSAQFTAMPWGQWVDDQSRSEAVRHLLRALGRLSCYENDPAVTSAGAVQAQLQRAVRDGVLYLDGGWQTLVDGLRRAATNAGTSIVPESPVERVDASSARPQAVLSDGSTWDAAHIVLATDAPTARQLCSAASPANSTPASSAPARPVWVACLDLALRKLPLPRRTFVLGLDRPVYVSVHSASAKLTPAGMALVHIMKYLGPVGDAEPNALATELEALADFVQPGWREQLVVRQFLPKMQAVSAEVRADANGLAGRPRIELAQGVSCAGDWVGSDGMLVDGVLASARAAAQRILAQSPMRAPSISPAAV